MNGKKGRMLLYFLPEFVGVWIIIFVVVLLLNAIKNHYLPGQNLLETTRLEGLWNRIEILAVYVVVFLFTASIAIRSRIKYGNYFWPAAFVLGCMFGGGLYALFVWSESHTLIGKNFLQTIRDVFFFGVLLAGLSGGMSTFLGLVVYHLAKWFANH